MKSRRRGASIAWLVSVAGLCVGIGAAAHRATAAEVNFAQRFAASDTAATPPPVYWPSAATGGLTGQVLSNAYAAAQNPKDIGSIALGAATDAVRHYLTPVIGANAPDWAKRFEFEFNIQKDLKPTYSILTVQPLYQSQDKRNTLFFQASQLRYQLLDDYRDTSNIGLGYRRLLFDNSLLVGVNTFFDREWTYGHERFSVGGELKWNMLDFNTNIYRALTGYKTVDASTSTEERAMSGYDFELRSQVPFLPWLNAGLRRYHWDSDISDNVNGWSYSAYADITPNLSVEAGYTKDNANPGEGFVKLAFHLARTDRPAMLSREAVSDSVFERRDMRAYTLDKVRRENRIIVERRSNVGGAVVVIARGN